MLIVNCINLSFFLKILVELTSIKLSYHYPSTFGCAAGTILGPKPWYVLSKGQILIFSSIRTDVLQSC